MTTNQTAKKRSALKKSVLLMIILGVIFALLLIGYFAVLRPLLKEDEAPETVTYPPIWESEVESINGRVLMYPHYERSQINKITVHNPDNAKFGEQYVTWGFYKYTGPEKNDDGLIPGEFYLQNYEYAPFDSNGLANMIVGAGYTLATARVEDHCDDYSRYGLDFKSPEEARSVSMETADGKTFVYTPEDVLQVEYSLAQLEGTLNTVNFFRCSKSMILNIDKVAALKSLASNRIDATMKNGEHILISRTYASDFRRRLKGVDDLA